MAGEVLRRKELAPRHALAVVLIAVAVWAGVLIWQGRKAPALAHIDAGNDFARRGDGQNAVREWRLATRSDPDSSLAWQLLGQSFYEAHRYAQAREALLQVLRLSPDTPRLHSLLASCAHHLGDSDSALKYAREALKRDPNDVPALEVLAAVQTGRGNAAEITRTLRRLTELQPDKAENFVALAQVLMGQNNVADVIPVLDRVVQLEPAAAEMYALRGIARFYADGSTAGQQRCEDDFAHAMSIKPTIYACSLYLGRIYRRRGQLETAARFFINATHLNPAKADAYFDLASVEERRGNGAGAAAARRRFQALASADERFRHLRKQCDVAPDDFVLNLQVGELALGRQDYSAAAYYLARAGQLRPTDARVISAIRQLGGRKSANASVALPSSLADGAPDGAGGGP